MGVIKLIEIRDKVSFIMGFIMLFLLVITNFFGGEISLTTILIILLMIYLILNGIIIQKSRFIF